MAILGIGEKLHIVERRLFLEDVRRHFVREVIDCVDNAVRVRGYAWVFDGEQGFVRKPEVTERIFVLNDRQAFKSSPRPLTMAAK